MSPEQQAAPFGSTSRLLVAASLLLLLLLPACGHQGPAPQARETTQPAPLPPLPPDAPEFARCDAGDAEACEKLGLLYEYGVRLPRDDRASRKYFGRACLAGKTQRCVALARELEKWDPATSAQMWRAACEANHLPACRALGDLLLEQGDPEAIVVLRRACLGGDESSCPMQHGTQLFIGCRTGDGRACIRLGACMKMGACAEPNPQRRLPRPIPREKVDWIRI